MSSYLYRLGHWAFRRRWLVLGLWIVVQVLNGIFGLGGVEGGVAWFAHVGGFMAGILLIKLFARPQSVRAGR